MQAERLSRFLNGAYLLDLATLTPEGFPHVTPVWFEYDGKNFLISTTRERKKARNLMKNKNAGFSIAPRELPYAAVVGFGTIEIGTDPGMELIKRLCYKYLPANKAGKYFESMKNAPGTRITLTLHPTWMRSWEG
jgi:PPOX class probable F420-dependent enzyme